MRTRVPHGQAGRFAALGVAVLLAAAGCAFASEPDPTFDPSTPCNGAARQQMHGAYPDLEARIPTEVAGVDASSRDSGQFCARETLGTLWDAGFSEVEFGGSIFEIGDRGGLQVSVWRAPHLTAKTMADEYKSGAQGNQKVTVVSASSEPIAGRDGYRMNVLNGDAHQAILVWPSKDGDVIQVVIGSDIDETAIQDAVAKLG